MAAWLLLAAAATIQSSGSGLGGFNFKETAEKLKDGWDSVNKVTDNVDAIEAKTQQEIDEMKKSSFFGGPPKKALSSSLLETKAAPSMNDEISQAEARIAQIQSKVDTELGALNKKIEAEPPLSSYKAKPSSFVQTSENPDDGFAKVEAKLKALQEKIKADTAKFEQEAKAGPSSFAQTSENPDDGFAKVEAKLKALQEKIKADTAKFEAEAKAGPSSFVQKGDGFHHEDFSKFHQHPMKLLNDINWDKEEALADDESQIFAHPNKYHLTSDLVEEKADIEKTHAIAEELKGKASAARKKLEQDDEKARQGLAKYGEGDDLPGITGDMAVDSDDLGDSDDSSLLQETAQMRKAA